MILRAMLLRIKMLSKRILATRFFREGIILQIGSFLNTGIGIVSSVALVRLLGADEYGRYVVVIASIHLISWVTDPSLDTTAITRVAPAVAKADRERILSSLAIYLRASFLFLVVFGFLVFPFVPFLMRNYFHAPTLVLPVWLWIVGNMTQIGSRFVILLLQSLRFSRSLVWFEFLTAIISNLFRIAFVVTGLGVLGLAIGYVVGGVLTFALATWWYRGLRLQESYIPSMTILLQSSLKVSIKDFVKQSLLVMFDRRLSSFLSVLLVLFLGRYATIREVGYYELAFGVATTAFLLTSGFSRLMQIQFPRSLAEGYVALRRHYFITSLAMGTLSFFLLALTAVLSPWIIPFLYGAEFSPVVPIIWVCALALVPVGFMTGNAAMYRLLPKGLTVSISLTVLQFAIGIIILSVGRFFLQPLTAVLTVLVSWGWILFFIHAAVIYVLLSRNINAQKSSAL